MEECMFCKKDPDIVLLVPTENGTGQDFSCIQCATEHNLYCTMHGSAHTWFKTRRSGHGCLSCILDMAQELTSIEKELFEVMAKLLPREEWGRVRTWLSETPYLRDASYLVQAIAMQAAIDRKAFSAILTEILATGSADLIVPLAF